MAVADNRRRFMPLPDDRDVRVPKRCQPLAYPEAVLLVNPIEPEFKGQVTLPSFNSYAVDLLKTDQNLFLEPILNSTEVFSE